MLLKSQSAHNNARSPLFYNIRDTSFISHQFMSHLILAFCVLIEIFAIFFSFFLVCVEKIYLILLILQALNEFCVRFHCIYESASNENVQKTIA